MLFSFRLETEPLDSFKRVHLHDGDRSFKFVMGKGESEHIYTNIPVDSFPTVEYDGPSAFTVLAANDEVFMTPEQRKLNQNLVTESNVTFRISTRGTPKHAVVSFPAYRGNRGWAAPYGVLRAERFDLDDTLYISFQDPYLTAGSYFLSDSFGNDPVPAAVEVINRALNDYSLTAEQATFVGASKGSNIAALVSQHFDGNQLILCNYSMDIQYRIHRTGMSHLESALGYFGIEYPDAFKIFAQESSRKETHWLYSEDDEISNRGKEQYSAEFLTTYASKEPHGKMFLTEWDRITAIVRNRHSDF
ncbi:hypothetical protein CSTAT_04225 [Corynebacterium stationis]|uniref:hypothetical protein n=1 Tax=Corynebacterium stationis TaxID=1705 RepID=UPI0009507734|nr:hypothetical protein [Corynebacterium stationis]APT94571.1 hypothetical protein CSTAT_04225 [Corynebacterium stationis]